MPKACADPASLPIVHARERSKAKIIGLGEAQVRQVDFEFERRGNVHRARSAGVVLRSPPCVGAPGAAARSPPELRGSSPSRGN